MDIVIQDEFGRIICISLRLQILQNKYGSIINSSLRKETFNNVIIIMFSLSVLRSSTGRSVSDEESGNHAAIGIFSTVALCKLV